MNEYTASNGVAVRVEPASGSTESYLLGKQDRFTHATGSAAGIVALREFFQAETDERLGRWRDPEHPERVVYKRGCDRLLVLDETDGDHWMVAIDDVGEYAADSAVKPTVLGWLAAHPEPKPWRDAEPGELWSVTTANQEDVRCFVVHNEPISFVTTDDTHHFLDAIVSAHRIYPPADPS